MLNCLEPSSNNMKYIHASLYNIFAIGFRNRSNSADVNQRVCLHVQILHPEHGLASEFLISPLNKFRCIAIIEFLSTFLLSTYSLQCEV